MFIQTSKPYAAAAVTYAVPAHVGSIGTSSGLAITISSAVAGDLMLKWVSTAAGVLTIPPTLTGYTRIGPGVASDPTGTSNDTAAALFAKWGAGETSIPADDAGTGQHRGLGSAYRFVHPDWISLMNSLPGYAYESTPSNNFVVPALGAFLRPAPVIAFSKRTATGTSPIPGLTEINAQSPANAEAREAWSGLTGTLGAGTELPFWSGSSAGTITTSAGRCVIVLPLYGKQN